MTVEFSPAEIDLKWRARWAEQDLYRTPEPSDRPTFYCLDFFPYPSGDGISVGHLRNYVPTDVLSRVMRMRGYDVLHPMGWDAFRAAHRERRHRDRPPPGRPDPRVERQLQAAA